MLLTVFGLLLLTATHGSDDSIYDGHSFAVDLLQVDLAVTSQVKKVTFSPFPPWRAKRASDGPGSLFDVSIEGSQHVAKRSNWPTIALTNPFSRFFTGSHSSVSGVNGSLRNMQWLHIPKTGTSFIATIWNYACGQKGLPLDLNVDDDAMQGCGSCYDFALMDRYPRQDYCEDGVLSDTFHTQHQAIGLSTTTSHDVVGMFRTPSQRLISAHRDKLHVAGFSTESYQRLKSSCTNASCFAQFPGVSGCMTRMLTGDDCADEGVASGSVKNVSEKHRVPNAIQTLSQMRFVGLTEDWDESVCLFHLMFGGQINPSEFKLFHGNASGQDYDEEELDGFVDEADEAVYAAAKARFEELRLLHAGENKTACSASLAHQAVTVLASTANQGDGGFANGTSCDAVGRQCGQIPGLLDCGNCPAKRLSHPIVNATGDDVRCSADGQCLLPGYNVSKYFEWFPDYTT